MLSANRPRFLRSCRIPFRERPYLWIWLASSYAGQAETRSRSGRPLDVEAPFRTAMEIYDDHAAKIATDIVAEPFAGINSEIIITYIDYALYLAATHRENEASDFVRKAALDAKHLTDPVETVNTLYFLALRRCDWGMKPAIERPARHWSTCRSRAPTISRNTQLSGLGA